MDEAGTRKVYEAFMLAAEAHNDVFRKSGEPYITHPLEVARILADLRLDADTLCAALLHDVLEDTNYQREDIEVQFGATVGELVEGVTKLEQDEELPTKQAVTIASFRKMMKAMTRDFRVVLIKLADRLHNMRTLGSMPAHKRRCIAEETITIYVPLARRMGVNDIRRQLQVLSFQNLYSWRSRIMSDALKNYLESNESKHRQIFESISDALVAAIPGCNTVVWEKNLYRAYEQSKRKRIPFRQQCDLLEISVQVGEISECYQALGIIHRLFRPRMGLFRDFIAVPRAYGLQALQTTTIAANGQQVRFQIQTRDMFQMAQYGIAAQWRYPDMRAAGKAEYTQNVLNRWISQVNELESQAKDSDEFYADIRADMFQTEVYAYTPAGDAKEFPRGATLVDFAYAIHTEVGHHCVSAKVNGVRWSLRSRIPNNMATIEIITDDNATPQLSWLNFVKTSRAISNIRAWLRQNGEQPENSGQKITAGIEVEVRDIKGMLRQITKCLDNLDVDIIDLHISGEGRVKQDTFTLMVDDQGHLQEVIRQLKHIPNVLNVSKLTKKD